MRGVGGSLLKTKLPRTLTALAAALLLVPAVFLPAADAGTLPEDVLDAARDSGDDEPCPATSLDQLLLCIVDQTVNDNPIVRAVVTHVGYHYQNASNARNFTVAELLVVAGGTLAYEWQVEYGGYVYAGSTLANERQLEDDADEMVDDAGAYVNAAVQGECVFLLGSTCLDSSLDSDRVGSGLQDDAGNPTCNGLVNIIRCHYVRVVSDALDQADNATGNATAAATGFVHRQDEATAIYAATIYGSTTAYARFLVIESDETLAYEQGFVNRECKLVYSGCPATGVTVGGWVGLLS